MDLDNGMKLMEEKAETIARFIEQQPFVRIFSHNDGDGLTSAAIMASALSRKKIPFHITNIPKLDAEILEYHKDSFYDDTVLLFCDIGSGQQDILKDLPNPMIILDHHAFSVRPETPYFLNPEDCGLSGSTMVCGAGVCYLVAEHMDSENVDLSTLAIAAMESDRQLMIAVNSRILEKAKAAGLVDIRSGLRIGDGDLADVFMYTLEPFLDITGKPDLIEAFLKDCGLFGKKTADLTDEEQKTLTKAVSEKLTAAGCLEGLDACIGDTYILKNRLIGNVCDFSAVINSCGNFKEYGLGLSVCMNDVSALEEAMTLFRKNREMLLKSVLEAVPLLKSADHVNYMIGKDMHNAGEVASAVVRYVDPSKPVICLNVFDDFIKVSGRGTRALIEKGLDLAVAFKDAADAVGGRGGGHNIASGGSLPSGCEDEFLKRIDEIVGAQIG